MGPWRIILWDMYINMIANKLLILTHYTHIEIFLIEAEIISTEGNIIFDNQVKELQYDPEDVLDKLGINEDWKSQNQVTIDQRKKQLEQ